MQKQVVVLMALVAIFSVSTALKAETIWEGSGSVDNDGSLPSQGFYGLSNGFPINTQVKVHSIDSGLSIKVVIIGRLDNKGNYLISLSREAGSSIRLAPGDVAKVMISFAAGEVLEDIDSRTSEAPYSDDPEAYIPLSAFEGSEDYRGVDELMELSLLDGAVDPLPVPESMPEEEVVPPEPEVSPQEPEVIPQEPEITETPEPEPEVIPQEPEITETPEPEVIPQEPEVTESPEPEVSPQEPEVTETPEPEPEVIPQEPEMAEDYIIGIHEGYIAPSNREDLPNAEIDLPVPEVVPQEPEIAETPEPEAVPQEPEVAQEPEMAEDFIVGIHEGYTAPSNREDLPNAEVGLPVPEVRHSLELDSLVDELEEPPAEEAPELDLATDELEELPEVTPPEEDRLVELVLVPADLRPPPTDNTTKGAQKLHTPDEPEIVAELAPTEDRLEPEEVEEPSSDVLVPEVPDPEEELKAPPVSEADPLEGETESEATDSPIDDGDVVTADIVDEVPVRNYLENGYDYIQLGSFYSDLSATALSRKLGIEYPAFIWSPPQEGRRQYKVIVGPLNRDESGALLFHFKSIGFNDAFLRGN